MDMWHHNQFFNIEREILYLSCNGSVLHLQNENERLLKIIYV